MTKILLAEDDLFLRDIYQEVLLAEGFNVTTAVDGEEALAKFNEGGWDLVLMDVIMPKMTGIDVLHNLKVGNPHELTKRIVFMTNSDDAKEVEAILNIADGYLLKSSYNPDQLLQKVKQYLQS